MDTPSRVNYLETNKVICDFLERNRNWQLLVEKKNLKLRQSMISALNWFYDNNEYGVVLEDDCFPSLDFFTYAEKGILLLQSGSVATFSGTRFSPWKATVTSRTPVTYVWGWGTSKDIWQNSIKSPLTIDPLKIVSNLETLGWHGERLSKFWIRILSAQCFADDPELKQINGYERAQIGQSLIDSTRQSWDYTLVLSLLAGNNTDELLYSLRPPVNLINNSGFGSDSTHFVGSDNRLSRQLNVLGDWNINLDVNKLSEFYELALVFGHGNRLVRSSVLMIDKGMNK
jgi:hypothetical protein